MLAVFGWIVALLLITACVFGPYGVRSRSTYITPAYSTFESAFFNGFSKVAWSVAIMWIIIACVKVRYIFTFLTCCPIYAIFFDLVKGHGGIINSFLSWGFFKPLARLNYITYLTHPTLMSCIFFSMTYAIEFTDIIAVSGLDIIFKKTFLLCLF